jgi:hypothetical protein
MSAASLLSSETLHASCVAIDGRAVLISGRSGAGKSDLALRLIDRGAVLVSDDYTIVRRVSGQLLARAPANIEGRMEVRGLGILPFPSISDVPVVLLVDLNLDVVRLPEPAPAGCAGRLHGAGGGDRRARGLRPHQDRDRAAPVRPRQRGRALKRTPDPNRVLLVTGLSGAGKSTALRTLEDIGWEVVDNLPLALLDHLLSTPLSKGAAQGQRPLAIGIDSRTRGFDAGRIVKQIKALASDHAYSGRDRVLRLCGRRTPPPLFGNPPAPPARARSARRWTASRPNAR